VKRILAMGLAALITLLAAIYLGDYAVLRYRAAKNLGAFGSVTIYRYYAIQKKANKTEYVFKGSDDQTCVNSMLPHMGHTPCWYLQRHTEQRTDI
jgi:hypothetical protein